MGIYFFGCTPDDGAERNAALNSYSWILQVTPSYKVSATALNPNVFYQSRDSTESYNLNSVCTDSGGSSITRVLLLNGTSVPSPAFAPFLGWNPTTGVLTYTLTNNLYSGTQSFSIVCSNNQASTASTSFTIYALGNYPPVVLK